MNRKDFLAIIPSLSAIPFIGKDIIRKSDRIEIFQPEQVEQEIHHSECEVHVVKNGKILAKGWIESVEANREMMDVSCRDNGGERIIGLCIWDVTAQVRFNTPIGVEGWNAMHDITTNSMRHIAIKLKD